MPEQIHCPSCNAALRVPETLLGKAVKCPKCKTSFTAAVEAPSEPEPDPETEGVVTEPTPAARRRPRREEPDEEEESSYPDEEDERPRRRRRRKLTRRVEEAESAVVAPAICLMVLGGFDILLQLVNVLLRVLNVGMFAAGAQGQAGGGDAEVAGQMVGGICGAVIGLCFSCMIIVGGLKMKQLNNYGLAMTACILAMLPCGNCCLIGLPIGIWALIVLNKPEVKGAFN